MTTRRPAPHGRCVSCGKPLNEHDRTFLDGRFCWTCQPRQDQWAIVDTWRSIIEAMRVIRDKQR